VTIYAIEPDVPLPLYVRGSVDAVVIRRGDKSFGEDPRTRPANTLLTDFLANRAVTLTSLTEKTGGRWYRGLKEIDDTFEQVTEDLCFDCSIAPSSRLQIAGTRTRIAIGVLDAASRETGFQMIEVR
jgi:hypothetical protein